MQVSTAEIPLLCNLIQELCGIALDDQKGYLLESRLTEVAKAAECSNFADLVRKVRQSGDASLKDKVIDAITTGETLFFRDESPFAALQHKALPELIDTKSGTAFPKRIRIWSAACSTGQEPYSIAMTLRELIPFVETWDISILATDISDQAIARASRGVYLKHEIQRGMNPKMLTKYFVEESHGWRIRDEVRAMVSFQRLDLTKPFVGMGPFDIAFCRNVAIYFDQPVKDSLFRRMSDLITNEGYLFVGSAENLSYLGSRFQPQRHCQAIFYQPNRLPAMARA